MTFLAFDEEQSFISYRVRYKTGTEPNLSLLNPLQFTTPSIPNLPRYPFRSDFLTKLLCVPIRFFYKR